LQRIPRLICKSANIQLFRDTIIYFTASGAARGVSGHTGGPYDTVPELVLLLGLFESSDKYLPVVFDEAGHRVATQYLLSALEGHIPTEHLLHYREANSKLPGHPEVCLVEILREDTLINPPIFVFSLDLLQELSSVLVVWDICGLW
jgi:transketolase